MTLYVIIGGSAGAVGAVEGIRKLDPTGEITVVTEEPMAPYSRPAIGEHLDGRVDLSSLRFGSPDFWNEYSVRILLGRRATSFDLACKTVRLDDDRVLGFDRLLLATGTKPFIPKVEGMDREGIYTFTGLKDVQEIRKELPGTNRAVIVGGGLIGVEAAEALVNLGVDVTVVELKGWLLNLLLDREAAGMVELAMESRRVKLFRGESVKEIFGREDSPGRVGGVVLSSGTRVRCDLVVSAVGVVPRTELAVQAGLKVNRGILVDRYMQTSDSSVYACGDVVEVSELLGGGSRVFAVWSLARLGGRVAGANMAGGKVEYPGGLAMSALRYFGVPIVSVGLDVRETIEGFEVLTRKGSESYKKIVLRGDRVVGFTLVRDIEAAGLMYNLMRSQTEISGLKGRLLSSDFSFAHLPEKMRRRTLMEAWA